MLLEQVVERAVLRRDLEAEQGVEQLGLLRERAVQAPVAREAAQLVVEERVLAGERPVVARAAASRSAVITWPRRANAASSSRAISSRTACISSAARSS